MQFKEPIELLDALTYFKIFVTDQMSKEIFEEINSYYFQLKSSQILDTNSKEIEVLLFKMGIVKMF